jgi:integrase
MRTINRLTVSVIKGLVSNPPEKNRYFTDGNGLCIQVTPTGTASWILVYQLNKRRRELGLGRWPDVGLAEARERAGKARKQRTAGIDPLGHKQEAARTARRKESKRLTFSEAAAAFMKKEWDGWAENTRKSWTHSLELYIPTSFGNMDVADIETDDIMEFLGPLWKKLYSTAKSLRSRIESILDWAAINGSREKGLNPARYKGHLEHALATPTKKVEHQAAIDWREMPEFMAKLRKLDGKRGDVPQCLEYIVLTGVRSEEATGAIWREIDLAEKVWRIPGARMKMKEDHHVPLSSAALKLLKALPGNHKPDDRVFSTVYNNKVSGQVVRLLLPELGYPVGTATVHGARSSLRTWAAESAKVPERVAEALISHDTRSGTQKSYEHTRFFEDRVPVMERWARFLEGGKVVSLADGKAARKRAASVKAA